MYCRNCGNEVDENAVACVKCGHNPMVGAKHCPNCGVEVESSQVVCIKCGGALKGDQQLAQPNSVAKSKIAYLLLAIFLGEFGVHNFYAGYSNTGVIQLLVSLVGGSFTCGISMIVVWGWAIFEGITVNKDASGKPFDK